MKSRFVTFFILLFAAVNSSAQVNSRPMPLKTYLKDGISVKAYDFKTFEPLLHIENDSIYVVNFWATWCAPCVAELPNFEKLNEAYQGNKVKVILVSLDMQKQVESNLLPFVKKKNLKSEVVYLHEPDADSWISKVSPDWSGALPVTLIYSKDKRAFFEQTFEYEALEAEIKKFITK